jgi:hypothetical protein
LALGDLAVAGIGVNVKYKDASNTRHLYICSHDGVTYSETDTSTNLASGGLYTLEIIYTAGVNIEVKINGVSVGAKATNLPSGIGADSRWGIMHSRSGGSAVDAFDGIRTSYFTIYGAY